MSQKTLSRELALRIGLAARALPDTDAKRLLDVLTEDNSQPISRKRITQLTLTQLKSARDGEFSEFSDSDLQQALSILKEEASIEEESLPQVDAFQEDDMPGSIRIACASNDAVKVDGHFGSCSKFMVYQVSAEESRLIDIRTTKETKDLITAEKNEHRAKLINDCQVLYLASVGGPAAAKIVKAGIHPINLPGLDPIDDVIKQLQEIIVGTPPPWLAKAMGIGAENRVRFKTAEAG